MLAQVILTFPATKLLQATTFHFEIKSNGFNPLDIHRSNPIEAYISN